MARKAEIYRTPPFDAAMARGIGETNNRSRRVAQVCERYLELLKRAELPAFSEPEWMLMRDALDDTAQKPAMLIRGVWMGVDDIIRTEGAADKWGVDGPALIERLKGMSYLQEVALVEEIETWLAAGKRADAPSI
jgi:hypothetical protein